MDSRPAKCPDFPWTIPIFRPCPGCPGKRLIYPDFFRERDLDIKHINIALKAINLNLEIQNFPGREPSDPPPSMHIPIPIALLRFLMRTAFVITSTFFSQMGGGGS